ncbi:MAG: quinolinate synthase NadA [Planctomycetes bacterium]|nr:quinolinate synthase NadA [Planctomycetota bacterium]MCG2685289.1 quinolinate synthase NadA [Planctomycetales bacterium]
MSATHNPTFDLARYESLEKDALVRRVQAVRAEMGPRLLILGHHYQQDEVIALADLRGDSYGLSELAANSEECRAIVFCGVHFMAETADILANRPERLAERGGLRVPVILPDLDAGCSLADMADVEQVEKCWSELAEVIDIDDVTPITYVNSAAELKAFCGRRDGIVCTSSNARAALDWAFQRRGRVLFFPDQHLGRNTARTMGIPLEQMPLWDPRQDKLGGNSAEAIRGSRVILWRGFCCVHQRFTSYDVAYFRAKYPGIKIIVHPECMMEVADLADVVGSTSKIIREIEQSPPGTRWAIGTELHLVDRLRREHPEQEIHLLSNESCVCSTMFRINLPRLCWAVENLAAGTPVNVIEVEPETARWALEALRRMLDVK